MKETIYISENLYQANIMRTLSKNGVSLFNARFMNTYEYALYVLNLNGISIDKKKITKLDKVTLLYLLLRDGYESGDVTYFGKPSYKNAQVLAKVFDDIRMLNTSEKEAEIDDIYNTLKKGIFSDKNDALVDLLNSYLIAVERAGTLDEIDIIKMAIKNSNVKAQNVVILSDLLPLEDKLIESTALNIERKSVFDLFSESDKKGEVRITKARGKINEVADAFKRIYDEKIPFDKCLFVTLDSSYDEIINDFSNKVDVIYSTYNGVNISIAYPMKLYSLYNAWDEKKFNNIDSLKNMVNSIYFKKELFFEGIEEKEKELLLKELGSMKISSVEVDNNQKLKDYLDSSRIKDFFKKYYNSIQGLEKLEKDKYINDITRLIGELSLPTEDFIEKYSVIRKDNEGEDYKAIEVIRQAYFILRALKITDRTVVEEILNSMYQESVCSCSDHPGYLHVCKITDTYNFLRENVFIFGLSSDIFPGGLKENYALLDSDIELFGYDKITSTNELKTKVSDLVEIVKTLKKVGSNVNLSFSSFDIAAVKGQNPSSVLYEIYKLDHENATVKEFEDSMITVESFFKSKFSIDDYIGMNHIESKKLNNELITSEEVENNTDFLFKKKYSPSAIEKLNNCPLLFMYERLMGLSEAQEDNPFEVISAIDYGNLSHLNMEVIKDNPGIDKNEFREIVSESFDSYMKSRIALDKSKEQIEKNEFIEMMMNEYDVMKSYTIIETEKKVDTMYNALILEGRLDCLSKDKDGNYVIVDYKTGRSIHHAEDDFQSCIQALLYAYMLELKEGIAVNRVEYHYLRYSKIIKCDYEINKEKIESVLNAFIDTLKMCNMPSSKSNNDYCMYCKHKDLCNLINDTKEEADE